MNKSYKSKQTFLELFRYIIVGFLTTVIGLGLYYTLTYTILSPSIELELQVANIISWVISVSFAFFANKLFVFKDYGKVLKEMLVFYLGRIGSLVAEMALMHILVYVVLVNHRLSKIFAQGVVIIMNYVISKYMVFKNHLYS